MSADVVFSDEGPIAVYIFIFVHGSIVVRWRIGKFVARKYGYPSLGLAIDVNYCADFVGIEFFKQAANFICRHAWESNGRLRGLCSRRFFGYCKNCCNCKSDKNR